MKNCLILGFGRSGTSLMGGILHQAGYFLGNHLHPARDTNPKGFFEDMIINRINEQILESYDYSKIMPDYPKYLKPFSPYNPKRGQRWLSMIKPGLIINYSNEKIIDQIEGALKLKQPFAYKDPRFNYTFNVWESYLPEDTHLICMYRNPAAVVNSVVKECASVNYLREFYVDEDLVFQLWYNSYRHIIDSLKIKLKKKLLFISYEDIVKGKCLNDISSFLDISIGDSFVDPSLNRTPSNIEIPNKVKQLYNELQNLRCGMDL